MPDGQILTGLLTLLVAVIFAICGRQGLRPTQLRTLAQQLLRGPSLAAAGIAGLGIALPSVDYLAAPAAIMASGTAALTQVAVLLMCNVVAFALMEIPLLAYLLAPTATVRWVASLHNWIRSRRRVDVAFRDRCRRPVGHLAGTDHHCARHGYIGGAGELAVVTTELAQQRPLSQTSAG